MCLAPIRPGQFALGGSRAVAIAAQADTPDQASERAETACQQVVATSPDVWHRSDIGRIRRLTKLNQAAKKHLQPKAWAR